MLVLSKVFLAHAKEEEDFGAGMSISLLVIGLLMYLVTSYLAGYTALILVGVTLLPCFGEDVTPHRSHAQTYVINEEGMPVTCYPL
jgi:hypothetical protein